MSRRLKREIAPADESAVSWQHSRPLACIARRAKKSIVLLKAVSLQLMACLNERFVSDVEAAEGKTIDKQPRGYLWLRGALLQLAPTHNGFDQRFNAIPIV